MPYKSILNGSLSILLLLSACAGLPVRGSVGMQTIETRVDSEAARYYLGSYLGGERSDAALDERIDRVYQVTQTAVSKTAGIPAIYVNDNVGTLAFGSRTLTQTLAAGTVWTKTCGGGLSWLI